MKLTLPYPPSTNRYWRFNPKFGSMYVTHEARKYKADLEAIARRQLGPRARFPVYRGPVAVSVIVYRPAKRGDLDNTLKVMLDALRGVAFVDDDQVVRITADRADDKANPRAEVLIQPRALEGIQSVLELAPAYLDARVQATPIERQEELAEAITEARAVETWQRLTPKELAAKAKPATISFRSPTQHEPEE